MEVLLTALPPQTQVQSVPISASATQTAPQLPPSFASLTHGTTIEGFVINRDAGGNPILRTDRGDVLVKSDLFLKTGSEVSLRLTEQNGQTNARIITIDNVPVKQYEMSASGQKAPAVTTSTVAEASKPLLQGALLQPASFGSPEQTQQTIANILRLPVAQLPPLEKGMPLQFRVDSSSLQAATPHTPPAPATNRSTATANAPTHISASAHYASHSAPQTPTALSNIASTPQAAPPAPNPAPPPTGVSLNARVIGHEGSETVVRTSIGTIKLYTAAPLSVDSRISLEFSPTQLGLPSAAAPSPLPVQSTSTNIIQQQLTVAAQYAQEWDTLKEAHQVVRSDNPAASAEMAARLPNTKSDMVNQVLFFVAALRGNDVQRWLGTGLTNKIEEKTPGLLSRLSADFNALRVLATESPEQPWQILLFPLVHEDELHQARLYVRDDGGSGNNHDSQDESRFILDVTLSQLGHLQIDGLVHGTRPNRQFDIVIRSEIPMDETLRKEIRGIYAKASEALALTGQMRFAVGKDRLITPEIELRKATSGDEKSILA